MNDNRYQYNKYYFLEEIKKAEKKLSAPEITVAEKHKAMDLIKRFGYYVQNDKFDAKKREIKILKNKHQIYEELERKFLSDLKKIPLNNWVKISDLYDNINLTKFEKPYQETFKISNDTMVELILDFYKGLDDEYYQRANQILNSDKPLVNLENYDKIESHCYLCDCLKLPFISVCARDNHKFQMFIHELQHAIDWMMNDYNEKQFCTELGPIFFEILITDIMSSFDSCDTLYNIRLNSNISMIQWLKSYADILVKFDACGRKINKDNINQILNIQNKDDFYHKSNRLININFVDYYDYIVSFCKALELREEYYNVDRKQAIHHLKKTISGNMVTVNFLESSNLYNSYINEVLEKQNNNLKL